MLCLPLGDSVSHILCTRMAACPRRNGIWRRRFGGGLCGQFFIVPAGNGGFVCAFRCLCGGCPARRNTEMQREITGFCVRKSGGGNLRHGFREDTENGKRGSRKGESGSRLYSGKLTGTASGMADMDFLQSAYFLLLAADFSRLLSVGVCLRRGGAALSGIGFGLQHTSPASAYLISGSLFPAGHSARFLLRGHGCSLGGADGADGVRFRMGAFLFVPKTSFRSGTNASVSLDRKSTRLNSSHP